MAYKNTYELINCLRSELQIGDVRQACYNAVEFLEDWFHDINGDRFDDFRFIVNIRKYRTAEETLSDLRKVQKKLLKVARCSEDRRCHNPMLCPACNKTRRKRLLKYFLDQGWLQDPDLGLYLHKHVFEFPRGVYRGKDGVQPQARNWGFLTLKDTDPYIQDRLDYLDYHNLECYKQSVSVPNQLVLTVQKITEGQSLYNSKYDVCQNLSDIRDQILCRYHQLLKRYRNSSSKPTEDDSILDTVRFQRNIMQRQSISNGFASRLVVYPVIPEDYTDAFQLVRVQKNTLFLFRKEPAKQARQYPLFKTMDKYAIRPFYPDMETPIYYRESFRFQKKRIKTTAELCRLLKREFRFARSIAGFLPEELIAYTYGLQGFQANTLSKGD